MLEFDQIHDHSAGIQRIGMGNDALKNLSHQYMRGEISEPEYRLQRREIINQLTGFVDPESAHSINNSSAQPLRANAFLKASLVSIAVVIGLLVLYSAM